MAVDNRNFVNTFANEGGADVLVEDKRMDELKSATAKTGSQISTSAQYIPLQDTDGNLVKINPASFEEAVRNVLGSLLANNDKGTTISAVPALSGSGASLDFGSISPANLASVLGVMKYTGEIRNGSLNNYVTPGVYAVRLGDTGSAITDYPSELEGENSMMIVFPAASSNSDSYILQVIMSYQSVLYLRLKVSSWERWYKVSLT